MIGTPASCSASDPAHTVAIDELPLLSVIVDSSLTVKGKSSYGGMTGMSALSARFPWPTSLRLAAPTRPVSPTEDGGKK